MILKKPNISYNAVNNYIIFIGTKWCLESLKLMTDNPKKATRRDVLKGICVVAAASALGGGAGYYFDSVNRENVNRQAESFNAPSASQIAEIQQLNSGNASITPTPSQPTTDATTATASPDYHAETSGDIDSMEHMPEDTTPGLGQQPKNLDWNNINPMTIRIPDVGFNAGLQYTGSTDNPATGRTEINIPVTYRIGVYTDSAPLTSNKGTTLLVGHVNWANGVPAPMSAIVACERGNTVYTTDENGTMTTWKVTRIEPKVPQVDLSKWWDVTDKKGSRKLIMATCHGTYKNGTWTYTDNHVVVAEPVA